jgi:pimeloyl-ACP methyl ester carboxylesterase
MASRLPVIYVRGFAGSTGGINDAVDDAFYGFNLGATHIRVGSGGEPRFYQFEGPLLRLLLEEGYQLSVRGGQQAFLDQAAPDSVEPNTVWIYRFYDPAASTFGAAPEEYDIDTAAQRLATFVDLVLAKTRDADQVHLVAHSMGGLICRSAIQRHLAEPAKKISKVFTYGTPHGGIDVELGGPIGEWVMETFGPAGSDIFRPKVMYGYLKPKTAGAMPRNWDPRSLGPTDFPVERIFCLVGTNAGDYDVAAGWSTRAIGVKSDGLVQIRNAYVKGATRAYVHRAHSGRYGLVNSEEGWQNLVRFLFGDVKVETGLWKLRLNTADGQTWQADVKLSIRGIAVVMHEQTAEHHCPVQLVDEAAQHDTADSPVPLITTYLLGSRAKEGFARYALSLRVTSLIEKHGIFWFRDHLEQIADWEDTLVIDVAMSDDHRVSEAWWGWNSALQGKIADIERMPERLASRSGDADPLWTVPLTDAGRAVLGPDAVVSLRISPWT